MRFTIYTLIDITQTGARRGEDHHKYGQQQNFLTLVQTLSLRANPNNITIPVCEKTNLDQHRFGSSYQGVHRVWRATCEFEYEGQHSAALMVFDFDFVPVVTSLDETVKTSASAFLTRDRRYTNILFVRDH